MNVLVTGGAGYIGSHTTYQLIEAGHKVTIIDNLSTGHKWAVHPEAKFIHDDLENSDLVSKTLTENKIQAVIHFAAFTDVLESISQPIKYYKNNVKNTLELLQQCQMLNLKHFIFSSSAAVYGNSKSIPINETEMTNPISPYGRTKEMVEKILQDMSVANKNFKYIALRYFNVAGARSDLKLGQSTPKATQLIKVAAEVAAGKRKSISIFGNDYPTKDGTCIRDFIHVEDLATAHVEALNYLAQGGDSQILNCGYGQGFSVKQVVDTMKKVSGNNFEVLQMPRRDGDIETSIADNKKIKNILKWNPKFNDLNIICKSAYEWEEKCQ